MDDIRHERCVLAERGTILVSSLWILAILSVLAVGIGFRVSIEARLAKYEMDRIKARYAARAGIFKCMGLIAKDDKPYDTMNECGFSLRPGDDTAEAPETLFTNASVDPAAMKGYFTISYEQQGVSYPGMSDEERRININTADQQTLERLFSAVLSAGDYEDANPSELAQSALAWRGANTMDDDYYNGLEKPYKCKRAKFSVPEELMLVKGFTPRIYDAIKEYVTVFGDSNKPNINTAARPVMIAMGINEIIADDIINYRSGGVEGSDIKTEERPISDIMADLEPILDLPTRQALINSFTTMSNYFRIDSKGSLDRSKIVKRIVCVVKRGDKKLLYYHEY